MITTFTQDDGFSDYWIIGLKFKENLNCLDLQQTINPFQYLKLKT